MIFLGHVATLGAGIDALVTGITDLDIAWVGGQPRLYSVTRPGIGGYAAFDIGAASGAAAPIGQVSFVSAVGHLGTPQLTVIGGAGGGMILPAGLTGADYATYALTAGGGFGGLVSFAAGAGPADDLVAIEAITLNGQNYLLAARDGAAQPFLYNMSGSGGVSLAQIGGQTQGAGIDALVSVTAGGVSYAISASAAGDRIASYAVSGSSGLHPVDTVDSASGIGFSAPTVLAAAEVAGASFVIVGGSVSSSLTVFRVLPGGEMFAVDHVVDNLLTRFQGVTALETLVIGTRAYVFVGGGDDGITALELLPDGRLIHRVTLADTVATTLADVTAIAAAVNGGRAQVFVTSASEVGISQFDFGFGTAGQTIIAASGAVPGGAGDDLLIAGAATTAMHGGGGGDVLVAGGAGGAAVLTGGAGSDIFVLSPYAGTIRITDYQPGVDRLDLTSFPMLRSLGQMMARMTATGAELIHQGTTIRIDSATGSSIPISAFAETDLFGLLRFSPLTTAEYQIGSAGDDLLIASDMGATLIGLGGNDDLQGGAARDLIEGGTGNDRLTGGGGVDRLDGGFGNDLLDGGDGADVLLGQDGNDTLLGAGGDDLLSGSWGSDWIDGGAGEDTVYGGGWGDTIFGNLGRDLLAGGDGHDFLDGGDGADRLFGQDGDDTMRGGAGADLMNGGWGSDLISGGTGNDTLYGGGWGDTLLGDDGSDLLDGGDGHDFLNGGNDADQLFGQAGNDTMYGGAGDDLVNGGSGDDRMFGNDGNDTLYGGDGDDLLSGQAGADLLSGGNGNDRLDGGAGDDQLYAHAGNDTLLGGAGLDLLHGGAGADVFVFLSAAEAGTGNAMDRIADFSHGEDRIDLAALALHFVGGAAFSGVSGELRLAVDAAGGRLEGDMNGDGLADFGVILTGVTAFDAGDLIL